MSFLVYFFVLLVAAGSVIFGLDWTQAPLNPPPYATPPAQTATANPAPARTAPAPRETPAAAAHKMLAKADAAPVADAAAQAQASATEPASEATTASVAAAAAHCNVSACSAAYRSFRASDCTYQPFGGERRLCTKAAVAGKVAAATHLTHSVRHSEPREERRLTDRRDYEYDRRGGWGLDYFFGGNAYDDER